MFALGSFVIVCLFVTVSFSYPFGKGDQRPGNLEDNLPFDPETLIVGGHTSKPGAWPWQALIKRRHGLDNGLSYWSDDCGGSLIGSRWVVTAAHCLFVKARLTRIPLPLSNITIVMGVWDRIAKEPEQVVRRVDKKFLLKEYNPKGAAYDIALLKLDKEVRYSKRIQKVQIDRAGDHDFLGDLCTVTGWGSLVQYNRGEWWKTPRFPDKLQQVQVPIVPQRVCEIHYSSSNTTRITEDMICAGYMEGGKDSCNGDSGGPMVCQQYGDCGWTLAGVVSWGWGCAAAGKFGVYARVSYFAKWIEDIIRNN